MATRVVLLFCHGAGLHKGVWTPIIRRLRAAGVSCECLALDWRYHGEASSDEDRATLFYESDGNQLPRVAHPANHWPQWAADHVRDVVAELTSEDETLQRTTQIIGVGHSIGAATLLNVEVVTPGTFAGLVLFEPILTFESKVYGGIRWASLLVAVTLMREDAWDTMEEAIAYIKSARVYRRWHPESVEAFIQGGLKTSRDGKRVRLATPLLHESALYCHEITDYKRQQLARMGCRVVVEFGSHTDFMNIYGVRDLVEAVPDKFTLDAPVPGLSHMLIMEDPDACAQRLCKALMAFPAFQAAQTSTCRL